MIPHLQKVNERLKNHRGGNKSIRDVQSKENEERHDISVQIHKEWHKEDGQELFSISSTGTKSRNNGYKLQPLRFHLIIRMNFLAETESAQRNYRFSIPGQPLLKKSLT